MADSLVDCVRDGTFPDDTDILGQEATHSGVSTLLEGLAKSKTDLIEEIQSVSRGTAGDVDEWIVQAKKLQGDIERCKIEARNIVEEHQRGEVLRNAVREANSKVELLEAEITFTRALEHEMEHVAGITQVLNEVEANLTAENPVLAVSKLLSLHAAISNISAGQVRSLLSGIHNELSVKSQRKLEHILSTRLLHRKEGSTNTLTIQPGAALQQSSTEGQSILTTEEILQACSDLGVLPSATFLVLRTIRSFTGSTIFPKAKPYASSFQVVDDAIVVTNSENTQNPQQILLIMEKVIEFLHKNIPPLIRSSVAHELLPRLISDLVSTWLDSAIPQDLHNIPQLAPLRQGVSSFAEQIEQYEWPGSDILRDWVEQIPRSWLTKRKTACLNSVRKAFSSASGTLRSIERVERQTVTLEEPKQAGKDHDDDWNTAWDDEVESGTKPENGGEDVDDGSGWGFDTDDSKSDSGKKTEPEESGNEDDGADAWGWGDEDGNDKTKEVARKSEQWSQASARQANGGKASEPKVQEMVLKETYQITDIPDHILEVIGRDMADFHELQENPKKYFSASHPTTGLAGLPNLTLALFRATAPTYYSLPSPSYQLSNVNLYNDTLYMIQKLNEHQDRSTLEQATTSLTKFARQIYTSELDIQRTILSDLLDGAQGFNRCTTFPESQACADAISSTVDRMRYLHKEWLSTLGESHLLQSLGTLMTMIFGKIIKDIEDMDDISEAESKQLVTFCQQILSLEDLFASRLPNLTSSSAATTTATTAPSASTDTNTSPPTQILLYVPNYLRFQYLQQILDSSLVDIKYLWTEGELSLDFSVDEVIDLIKALFAESQHRRGAIRAIRGSAV